MDVDCGIDIFELLARELASCDHGLRVISLTRYHTSIAYSISKLRFGRAIHRTEFSLLHKFSVGFNASELSGRSRIMT